MGGVARPARARHPASKFSYGMRTGRARFGVLPRLALAVALTCALIVPLAARAAARDFENPASNDTSQQFGPGNVQRHDTPNDPDYDRAEPDDEDGGATPSTNLYDEDFGYFGFPSARTPTALYLTGPNAFPNCGQLLCRQISGFNASGAWKLERGRPDTVIAILDTGIKWDRAGLRAQVHLNKGELPVPNHGLATPVSDGGTLPVGGCAAMANAYDANGDGAFNILDYVCDTGQREPGCARRCHEAGPRGPDRRSRLRRRNGRGRQRLRRRHRRLGHVRQRQRPLRRLELLRRRQSRLRPRGRGG